MFLFKNYALDSERRDLRADGAAVSIEPQVFDLLVYLIENRDRVVSKDDLIASVWGGRIVSESTLASRINAVRKAIGDSGEKQNFIRTFSKKGFRFIAPVEVRNKDVNAPPEQHPLVLSLPEKPSIAVLPFSNMSGDPTKIFSSMALQKRSSPRSRVSVGSSSSRAVRLLFIRAET